MPLDGAINLVSVDDVMKFLGATDADHLRIEALVNVASARIETFCGRKFRRRRETLVLDGNELPLLDLGGPTVTVHSVNLDGTVLVGGADKDYVLLPERGQLYRSVGWGRKVQSITVVASVGNDAIPHEVQEACLILIRSWFRTPGGGDFQSERIADYSYTRFERSPTEPEGDIPKDVQAMLLPHRRWAF